MKHNLLRIFKTGWTNFTRNSYMSFAVTGVMALALLLFLGLLTFQVLTGRVVSSIQEKVDISAYFKTTTSEEQIISVKADLEKLPEVAAVTYVSSEQAREDFKKRHEDDTLIQESLDQLDTNPFGATLNIRARDPENYSAVATFLENSRYRDQMSEINYNENKAVIDKINSFARSLRAWGLIVTFMLVIIATLITFNTIRLTIYNQKQEIEIMRLVGASNWHIQGPYLAEGGIYGAIAALVALFIFYPILYLASHRLLIFVPDVNLFRYFLINSWQIVLLALIVGVLLGMVSSIVAIRRHLKI
ncbi:MAG: permease-like cell division protein FtsX [Patescibacteria group bacterium]